MKTGGKVTEKNAFAHLRDDKCHGYRTVLIIEAVNRSCFFLSLFLKT